MSPAVMVVEDEILVALDLADMLRARRIDVAGPFATVRDALAHISSEEPACAILDVRLSDGEVYPLADALAERRVPIVFHSGHASQALIRARYPEARVCEKPCRPDQMMRTVQELMAQRDGKE